MMRMLAALLLILTVSVADAAVGAQRMSVPGAPSLGGRGEQAMALPASTLLPLHSRIAFEGDSITAGSSGPTYVQFALTGSQGRYFAPSGYNQAVGGQTAAQMAAGAQTAAVVALSPRNVVYLSGTNDLAGTADTPATIFANQRIAIEAYRAAGARVVFITTLPRTAASWPGSNREADRLALRALQLAQTDVTIVDLEATFDAATMTIDGLHPNYAGAILIGNAVASALNGMIVSDSVLAGYLTSDNHLVGANENPALTGTTGTAGSGITGSVASLWTVETNDAGITATVSKVTVDGREAQRIMVSGTNTTNGRIVNFRNIVAYSGSAGEFWEAWIGFQLAAGATGLRAISSTTDTAAMPNASATVTMNSELSGVMRPPMTNALAGTDTSVTIQGTMTFAAGAVSADITWFAPYYRRVPASQ